MGVEQFEFKSTNHEAERALLGVFLGNAPMFPEVMARVPAEGLKRFHIGHRKANVIRYSPLFDEPRNQMVFECMLCLAEQGRCIDAVTVVEELEVRGLHEKVGGAAYLELLEEDCLFPLHGHEYARIVLEKWALRVVQMKWAGLPQEIEKSDNQSAALLDFSQEIVDVQSGVMIEAPTVEIGEAAIDELAVIERENRKVKCVGLDTGFRGLDYDTAGWHPGDMVVVGARPAVGKSSFCLQQAMWCGIHRKRPVIFFSFEMTKAAIMQRILAARSGVPHISIRDRNLTDGQIAAIERATGELSDSPLHIAVTRDLNCLGVAEQAKRFKAKMGGLAMVVVDYLQLVPASREHGTREQEVSEVSRTLKSMALELECPVLAPSQLNRSDPKLAKPPKPQLSHLRESGSLEQDADVVIFLHRPQADQVQTKLLIRKQRNGPLGEHDMWFDGNSLMFKEE